MSFAISASVLAEPRTGSQDVGMSESMFDVVVVGGGAAGLNGAMMLGRSRRSVAVLDAGQPRNAPAHAVHGLLGHDGTPPAELLARGRAEVERYGGRIIAGEVVRATRADDGFDVELADGTHVRGRRLLVTTGLVDDLPDVPGLRRHWGGGVVHCPYCHGWEVRDQPIAVVATGPMTAHQALLFRQLSDSVVVLANGVAIPADGLAKLAARGIDVVEGVVAAVEGEDRITAVRLEDGRRIAVSAIAVAPRMVARASFLADLGLHTVEHPSGMGAHLAVDAMGRTDVPGVWAAGNVADISAQVGAAAAAGALAGAHINGDLIEEEVSRALAARAAEPAAASA
jgi:thioredoxin reductase